MQEGIRQFHSSAINSREVARAFYSSVEQPDMALVLFFCSSAYDLTLLAEEINRLFAGVQVIGCTTAGEIGSLGCQRHSLTGVSFSASCCTAVTGSLDHLQQFDPDAVREFGQQLLHDLEGKAPQANGQNTFAFLLIDGLSVREEPVALLLQNALGKPPLVGGSAGDDLRLRKTHVFAKGCFRSDSAALAIVTTRLPFTVFKTQHFVPTNQRMVITLADTEHRIVQEINGLPAAQEYARLLGTEVQYLNPRRFAASPVVVMISGNNYVRAIQKANPDGSLTFYCAIEEGLVLRLAQSCDLVKNLEAAFDEVRAEIGPPQLILGFDCILRRLEIVQDALEERVDELYRRNRMVGFQTYGEQFRGVHVNQTLTAIAIGSVSRR